MLHIYIEDLLSWAKSKYLISAQLQIFNIGDDPLDVPVHSDGWRIGVN